MRTSKLTIILSLFIAHFANSQDLEELKTLKESYDSIRTANKADQLIFVRTGNNKLIQVTDNDWPENIATTYNVLTSNGLTLLVGIYPYSESGDWSREHTYYFDATGRTFAYKHSLNSFNSLCADILKQSTLFFYDQQANELTKKYSILDKARTNMENKDCVFNYPYEHQPYKNLEELKREQELKGW